MFANTFPPGHSSVLPSMRLHVVMAVEAETGTAVDLLVPTDMMWTSTMHEGTAWDLKASMQVHI